MTTTNAAPFQPSLTKAQRHLYAAGQFGVSFMGMVIPQWVTKFYFANESGVANLVPILMAPWLMFLGRLTDGLNDPLVGYLSDNVRTRWGRRKPFMVVGLPLMNTLFVALWYPPDAHPESVANFWFGSLMLVAFFVGFTVYTGPYLALLPEITHDADQRLKLSALQGIYNMCGLIVSSFLTGLVLKAGMSYQAMAWIVMLIASGAFVCPILGAQEDPDRTADQERPPLIQSVVMTLQNRPFLMYVVSKVLFLTGLLLIVAGMPYAVVTLLGQPEGEAGIVTGIALLCGVAGIPPTLWAAQRFGRKCVYLASMVWLGAAASSLVLMAAFGKDPQGVWLTRGLVVLSGGGVAGLFALPYAFLSDITDHDKLRTGLDRQGMYFCMQGLIVKFAYAVAPMIVTGLLAVFRGHDAVVLTLVGPVAGVFCFASFFVFRAFPEQEVRAAVEAVARGLAREMEA